MTDPAERRSLVPRGTFDPSQPARDTEPDPAGPPLHSYIDELRTRVESLPDLDDDALANAVMVPPGAAPAPWVAGDIESALHAAAETVPRSPSSPDAPAASVVPSAPNFDSTVPPAELAPRHVRRPVRELVDDFPVELEGAAGPTLRARDRGRKSGRFPSPAGLRASLEAGSIAAAVKGLVDAERAETVSASTVLTSLPEATSAAQVVASPPEPTPAQTASTWPEPTIATVEENGNALPSRLGTVTRLIALFATASIAGGTAVYFLLHG